MGYIDKPHIVISPIGLIFVFNSKKSFYEKKIPVSANGFNGYCFGFTNGILC